MSTHDAFSQKSAEVTRGDLAVGGRLVPQRLGRAVRAKAATLVGHGTFFTFRLS